MDFTVTVLGSAASGFPGPGNAGSGFLVAHGDTRLLLDAGNGILGNLARHGRVEDLDAVVITHLHADHVQDLYPLALFLRYGARRRLRLLGPPGIRTLLYRWFHLFTREPDPFVEMFDITEYEPWSVTPFGALRVQPCPVEHAQGAAYALRVSAGDAGRLVYSGDSRPCALLEEAAQGADLLICEATFPPGDPALATADHLSWEDAAAVAQAAGAGHLVLTHLRVIDDPNEAVKAAAAMFDGPVDWAEPGRTFPIRSRPG